VTQSEGLDAAIRYAYDHLTEVAALVPQTPEEPEN
jgi:hypothetical protein